MQVGNGLPVQARSRSEIDRYGLEGLVLPVTTQGGHVRYLTNNSLTSLPLLKSTFEVKKKKGTERHTNPSLSIEASLCWTQL